MTTPKPHIVIVMGSFQTPWHYSFLQTALEESEYEATIVQLPSTGAWTPVPDALTKDTEAIREAVTARLERGNDVVVVAHSQGGVGASAALERLGKTGLDPLRGSPGRDSRGDTDCRPSSPRPGVLHVLYIQAVLFKPGVARIGGKQAPWLEVRDGLQIPHNALEILYNGVEPTLAEKAADLVVPNSRSVTEGSISYVPWHDMPCTYVICEQDKALPPEVARWIIAGAGVKCDILRIESGHSPFLSMPERTAAIVRYVAGESGVDLEGVKAGASWEETTQEGWGTGGETA